MECKELPMSFSRRLMPSLQELAAFEAAARHGSFTQAAEELSLTQSAISKQVRQVEEALDVVLFERIHRGVILTVAGRSYFAVAQEVLRRLESSTHAIIASGGSSSVLNLAVLPTFAARWLIPRLPRFTKFRPGTTINLATRIEPFDLEGTPFDLAIHYGLPNWPNARMELLFDEVVVPVASRAYRDRLRPFRIRDLDRAVLLQLTTRPALWGDWFAIAEAECSHPFRGPLFDQFSMTVQAAIASMGVALVPKFLVEEEVADGRLVVLFDRPMRGSGAYYAVIPTAKRRDPLVQRFLHWLIGQARAVRPK